MTINYHTRLYINIACVLFVLRLFYFNLLQLTPLYCFPVLNRPVLLQEEGSFSVQHTPSLLFLCKLFMNYELFRKNPWIRNEWVCHLILDTPPISLELPTYIVCVLTSSENCGFSREGTESSSFTQGGGFFFRSSAYSFLSQMPSLMSYEMFSYLDCG